MCGVDANLTDAHLAFRAVKPCWLSFVVLLRAEGLPLQHRFVVFILELLHWSHLVALEGSVLEQFMSVFTVTAHQLLAA